MERTYKGLGEMICELAEVLRPPERLTVSDAAEKYRYVNNPGSYVGPWRNETTPYMVEPANEMTNRKFNGVVFVGPAQTGKSDALIINPILYSVVCDPMDMLVYQTSQTMARDFSRRRIDRLHRHSPEVGKRMMPGGDSDNTFDKFYLSGMILTLSWPTINELSGRPVGRVILTDYDRMPMDVDGEGSPFDLARKRTTTFGTAACTIVESSPGYTVEDPRWLRRTPHEAPPCKGILALYNRGDRRRWNWKCPFEGCGEWFEPSFNLIKWVDSKDIMESAESAKMMCPHCTALIDPGMKHTLNRAGRWVRDGQKLTRDDVLEGTAIRSDIASFWMKGPAATFAKWSDLVSRYLLAEQEFERTGSQEALKSTVNTDQGEPYYPRGSESLRSPDELKQRASELPEQQVPAGVRFLVATTDVQKNQWVAQVFGVGPGSAGEPFKACVIDRFEIRKSKRRDDDGDALWVKPGAFLEDWDLVREQIIERRYPLADGSGELGIAFIACDSGGKDGVTANAYDFFRKLRRDGAGEHTRFFLVKGEGNNAGAPRVRISFPDAQKKDRSAAARGDVPVMLLNVNLLKDDLAGMIERATVDGGSLEWPAWLPDNWYEEMCAERRTDKGWENPRKARNEAWDLATYLLGVLRHKKVDRINWEAPPSFAEVPEKNAHFSPANKPVAEPKKGSYNKLADLAAKLA
jgi:phage terminase large subunit GpA-like protein